MIIKKNLNEQIYESLRRDILEQRICFGEKLVNRYLQEKYGVSSTPVRDAINRLYLDGLLDEISNGGARVISFDYKVALEVSEIVSMFTREAVLLAMSKGRAEALGAELTTLLELQTKNIAGKLYFVYDRKFHSAFFQHCENSRLVKLHEQYSALWELLILFYYSDSKDNTREKALSDHKTITNAVMKNDISLAQHCVERHFHEAMLPLRNALSASK